MRTYKTTFCRKPLDERTVPISESKIHRTLDVLKDVQQEGIKEGKNQKAVEIALNLFSLGASTDMIVKATGLTEEDVVRLHK
jgi:predicted transposase/invertase (TIGR01784 family)